MLVFIDESGDTGLKIKEGSSPYFIVTMVIFEEDEEALKTDQKINILREELNLSKEFEFHFSENTTKIKRAFFNTIVDSDFFYFSIIINKKNLYGEGFKYKDSFYKYVTGLLFENVKQYLNDSTIIIDGSGSRRFKLQLSTYLRKKINDKKGTPRIKKVKIQDSQRNNLIQLADMICGAITRSIKIHRRSSEFRRMVSHRELGFQFWPK